MCLVLYFVHMCATRHILLKGLQFGSRQAIQLEGVYSLLYFCWWLVGVVVGRCF